MERNRNFQILLRWMIPRQKQIKMPTTMTMMKKRMVSLQVLGVLLMIVFVVVSARSRHSRRVLISLYL